VALLRHSLGGAAGGVGPLVLLPVVWMALYGTRRELHVLLVGIGCVYAVPMVALGAPAYPASGWRLVVLQVVLAGIVGATVQRLIGQVRIQADQARVAATERAMLLAQVEDLARTDALTGVGNRRHWDEAVEARFAAGAVRGPVCVVVLDLDGFKQLNDTDGHAAGDRALRASATAWQAQLRLGDLIVRLGGDEFALLLEDCETGVAERVVARLRATMPAGLGFSAGIAEWDGSESAAALQLRADALLYAAKRRGRNPARSGRLELAG
jgi:diguanylate cyclase (GGDEF)-like protein